MKQARQIGILVAILTAIFALGFLAGISSARPLKAVFPSRSAENPHPEEFVQNFAARMTQHLNLTPEQQPEVEALIQEMSEQIRDLQRSFIPEINQALMQTIDKILPLLNEEQKTILQRHRTGIANSQQINNIGRPVPVGPTNRRPPRGGPPPWGSGPPPWAQELPNDGNQQTARPQRPPME